MVRYRTDGVVLSARSSVQSTVLQWRVLSPMHLELLLIPENRLELSSQRCSQKLALLVPALVAVWALGISTIAQYRCKMKASTLRRFVATLTACI